MTSRRYFISFIIFLPQRQTSVHNPDWVWMPPLHRHSPTISSQHPANYRQARRLLLMRWLPMCLCFIAALPFRTQISLMSHVYCESVQADFLRTLCNT